MPLAWYCKIVNQNGYADCPKRQREERTRTDFDKGRWLSASKTSHVRTRPCSRRNPNTYRKQVREKVRAHATVAGHSPGNLLTMSRVSSTDIFLSCRLARHLHGTWYGTGPSTVKDPLTFTQAPAVSAALTRFM